MEIPLIITLLILFTVVIIIIYYYWYIRHDDDTNKTIPQSIIHNNDTTIVEIFKNVSIKYGNYSALKVKINNKWKSITYTEYYTLSDNFAKLASYHVAPNPRTAIVSSSRPEWFYVNMGTLIANGLTYAIEQTTEKYENIINDACIELLVLEDYDKLIKIYDLKLPTLKIIIIFEYMDQNDELIIEILSNIQRNNKYVKIMQFDSFMNLQIGDRIINTTIDFGKANDEDRAMIIYPSADNTNHPMTHGNIISSIRAFIYTLQCKSNITLYIQEKYISYLPLNNATNQLLDMYIPISTVGIVHFPKNGDNLYPHFDLLKDIRPTIFNGTGEVWNKIMQNINKIRNPEKLINKILMNKFLLKEIGFDSVKYCIFSGGIMDDRVKFFFDTLGMELCNIYSMMEPFEFISLGVPGCSKGVGVPIVNVKIDLNTNGVIFKSNSIKTTDHRDNWIKTSDTGYLGRDGTLNITGKIK